MSDISKIKLASGKEYNIKDSYARELIGAHTHPIDTELDDLSTNPVQNSVITNALNNKADNTHTHTNESMGFGYCHTNYDYFCGIVDDDALTDGNIILCEFTNDVPANAILDINSTGDKPIYYNGSPITDGIIKAGDVAILKYNENLDLSFSRFDFIDLYHFYELNANNSNSQEEINIDAPIDEIEIINGQNFNIRFDYDVPANATLNIDGIDDDAKPIYYNGSPIKNNVIKANDNVIFIYNINDGRYDLLATDNYNNENVNHYYYEYALICYGITLDGYTQTKGGIVSIKFYYDVAPNATLNINSTGTKSIYHNGYLIRSDIIKAGDIATFIYDGTNYNLISLDRDFNIINESMGFGYGTCSTAASTIAKTVSMYGYELTKGGMVSIKFYNNVLSGATLNINNKGAKPIYHDGVVLSSLNIIIKAGDTATFIYDGNGYYLIARGNITNENMGFGYGICSTAASTIDKTVSIINYKLTEGGIVSIYFVNAVNANSKLKINNYSSEYMYYKNNIIGNNIIKAGDRATFMYYNGGYNLISLDRDFNDPITIDSSLSTTSNNPVRNSVITNALNNKADIDHTHTNKSMGFGYGVCHTAANKSNKEVSISNYVLTTGGIVCIYFVSNVPGGATLNINNTGDKSMFYDGGIIQYGFINAGDTATFIYNGERYYLISIADTTNRPIAYGICNTAASEIDKDASIDISIYKLGKDTILYINFSYDVPANSTLNINNTSYIPIYYKGSPMTDSIIKAGDTATFIYDGTHYNLISIDNNTNESMGQAYGICNTEANIDYKEVSIPNYRLTKGSIVSIKFSNNVCAESVLNINSTGAKYIFHKNTLILDNIIKANDTATFIYDGTKYNLISLDRDFNPITIDTTLSTTSTNPVQNSVITNALNNKADANHTHTIDTELSTTSTNPVQNKIITNALNNKADSTHTHDIDTELSTTSTNPVQNSVITNALNNKADANHTHTDATASSGGLMSATDKANIDNFAANFKNKLSIANGIATLDSNGKVPSIQLPSYVDDIIEGYLYNNTLYEEDTYTTEIIGETGKIYVDLSTNKTYRWGGSNYIEISESLALGETSSTAYRGDYGKIAYEHAQSTNNPHNVVPSVYGYCYTEKRQTTKIVTINDFKLIPGMIIFIRFTYGVPYQAYLNISNTGDKPIYYKGKINDLCVTENGSNDIIQAGDIVTFIYDAANNRYNLISTNIIGNQRMGSGNGYCDTAASVNEKSVSIREYVPFEGGIVSIYFVNAVNANSRLKINNYSSAYMYYKNNIIGNNIIKAGDRATFMCNYAGYYLISLDRDFNDPITIDSSLSTTSTNPVRNSVITNALNNYIPTIIGTQIESTNNWTGNAQFETLEDGQRILYYLPYNSSSSDTVLNLTLADGTTQTGNIDCYLSGSTRLNSQYEAGSFIPLIYKENITFNGSSTTYTGWWAYTDKDIDSKVQNTLNNTTKAYVTGTTNNTTNIGTQIFDDNVYLGTTAGELNTKSLKLNEKVTLNYNTNNNCIDFIFS